MPNVPQRLKELRKEFKLTQADIAKFLNISESAYGYYEQGRNEISISSLQKLAEKYGVSVAYILCESDVKNPHTQSINDETEFQAFANDPSLQKWYKDLPKNREEDLQKLRKMWEILKDNGEIK
ncbi:helix-turn-helix transcriptional regulator [Lysinibacillus sphaericus]|uniref:Transcriptional regulator n=1 Tax=Lysinibacillus sphaericus TaxID=1421 RepID=A0A2S0K0C0_LYSSH|nr:helix-turn-helix transcriptional regulator [Lysinibacillus sphaericus]AVK96684.1 transcriptional regulator [Lysinibacillus sphaericus]MED4543035.1 helix-turn-helix transcriptional regulator [Lysinibacillus sphaericus]TKI16421.1 helix-turn-helix transcriptional regulator [Lysinibacillus sphaericus]SUV17502.1 transcriptional regulator [Lysinibacillus sphaericus]GEC83938.1 transcriptional regulator [Lysinibacillus sphaericus]